MNKIEITGSKRAHLESRKLRNFGMNQASADKSSVNPAAAISVPEAIDIAH